MKRFVQLICSVYVFQSLSGCSALFGDEGVFRDRSSDYLNAQTVPPIEIPSEYTQNALEPLFDIPRIEESDISPLYTEFEVPRPNKVAINVADVNVRIQRLGDRQWVVIDSMPERVWPQVVRLLADTGIDVTKEQPNQGFIETDWMGYEDDTVTKNKYRISVEQGLARKSTEIHITHLMLPRSVHGGGQLNWPKQSVNAERESWLVEEIAGGLADEAGARGVSFLAQAIHSEPKARLVGQQDDPYLELKVDYSRAWASLGLALEKEGLNIVDDDRESGVYYIAYQPEGEPEEKPKKPGLLSRIFGSKSTPDTEETTVKARSDYQVTVKEAEGVVKVTILSLKAEQPESKVDEELFEVMTVIRGNLT